MVTCRDLPEAITQVEEAMTEVADCLEEAIAGRIDDERDIPSPSDAKRGERLVSVPPSMALKTAVFLAVRESGVSNSEFARRTRLAERRYGAFSTRTTRPSSPALRRRCPFSGVTLDSLVCHEIAFQRGRSILMTSGNIIPTVESLV